MQEKRRHPRVNTSWPIHVASISGQGNGQTINTSLCGVLFAVDTELKEEENVAIRIMLDSMNNVDCVARIVRSENRDGCTMYGADFRYMAPPDFERLNSALSALINAANSEK